MCGREKLKLKIAPNYWLTAINVLQLCKNTQKQR